MPPECLPARILPLWWADLINDARATGYRRSAGRTAGGGILGLFPAFDAVGGVQVSGQVAWAKIVEAWGTRSGSLHLFTYANHHERRIHPAGHQRLGRSGSHARAALAALRRPWPVRMILVWHLSLMKLLPFFRAPSAKVVVFLHGIEAWRPQGWLSRALLRRADLFLTNSDHTWQRFVNANPQYGCASHRTVHLGVLTPIVGSLPPTRPCPTALMLSRLLSGEDYKGHREVIDVWPVVMQRIPDAELWIAGDGDLRPELERRVTAHGIERHVRFWGEVSEVKKQELLAGCRCFALPSRAEGFGLVYLEAMRLGRPSLVSTFDAGREVVSPPEGGLFADPDKPDALAEALYRLLTAGPEWLAWSERARARYEAHFTADCFKERLMGALGHLLGS